MKVRQGDPSPEFEPGFGSSLDSPVGIPYVWPEGISVVGEIKSEFACFFEDNESKRHYGNGSEVFVCLTLANSTNQPINVHLLPGLIWVSESTNVQNGIIVKGIDIEVPAQQQFLALVNAYCVNGGRLQSPGFTYKKQPVITHHPGMEELYKLVAGKKLNFEQFGGVRDNQVILYGTAVASAVSAIANGDPIDEPVLVKIKAIPDE